jgi:hypothetical protein
MAQAWQKLAEHATHTMNVEIDTPISEPDRGD